MPKLRRSVQVFRISSWAMWLAVFATVNMVIVAGLPEQYRIYPIVFWSVVGIIAGVLSDLTKSRVLSYQLLEEIEHSDQDRMTRQ